MTSQLIIRDYLIDLIDISSIGIWIIEKFSFIFLIRFLYPIPIFEEMILDNLIILKSCKK